jgi:DNA-binding response OmpR family regulator
VQRILVADDNESVRYSICTALARAGFDVRAASDGEEAWEALHRGHYDMLITDNQMPRLSGIKLIERVRDSGMSLPIIMVTGFFSIEGVQDYARLRIAAVVPKPFDIREFLTVVKTALRVSGEKAAADRRTLANAPLPLSTLKPKVSRPARNHVLIADDDSHVRDSLVSVLESEGYVVDEARNGLEAVRRAIEHEPDLVLLDLNMPVKDGWGTFERLTAEHPFVPVIIVTARPNQLFTSISAGAGALLEKPMDIPTLLRTMERLLAESDEQRRARLAGKEAEFHYKAAAAGPHLPACRNHGAIND